MKQKLKTLVCPSSPLLLRVLSSFINILCCLNTYIAEAEALLVNEKDSFTLGR